MHCSALPRRETERNGLLRRAGLRIDPGLGKDVLTPMTEPASRMPSTHWSAVVRAARDGPEGKLEVLGALLQRYQRALMAHLTGKFGFPEPDAGDWLQGFVADKILERDLLARADPQRGRFRTFLLNSLDRYVISELRRQTARKRCPAAPHLPLHDLDDQGLAPRTPGPAFDVAWAQTLVADALRRMRLECEQDDRPVIWGIFEARLLREILHGEPMLPYDELVARYGLDSPAQASNLLTTGKRMFLRHLRAAVAEYAVDDSEIEAELRELKAVLARS